MKFPPGYQQRLTEVVLSRDHWQNITLGLFVFILAFVTFFYHTYQNVDEKLKKINKEQKRQTALFKKLTEEKKISTQI